MAALTRAIAPSTPVKAVQVAYTTSTTKTGVTATIAWRYQCPSSTVAHARLGLEVTGDAQRHWAPM